MDFSSIEALLVDIDGTVWRGDHLLPGAADFFSFLRSRSIPFLVATNNTKSPAEYRQKLRSYGIDIEEEHIFTFTVTTESYLREHFPHGGRAYVVGKGALKEAVASAGFALLPELDPEPWRSAAKRNGPPARESLADVVVVGGCFDLRYDHLKYASLHLQAGARLIGSNPDLLIPTEEGLVPEAGTTLAALEAATGAEPIILGKPEAYFFSKAVDRMGSTASSTAIIGDRVETDILGAQRAGLQAILVTTGVDTEETVRHKKIYPDAVFADLVALRRAWDSS